MYCQNTSNGKIKNITPYNENGKPHGYWEDYYDNGNLFYKGNYVDGKPHGYWEETYLNQINYYI